MQNNSNEENLKKVREAMAQSEAIKAGGNLKHGVPIDYTADSGKQYKGTVIFKRPTIKDYLAMGGAKSEILRQAGVQVLRLVDPAIALMAEEIATLKVVVAKSPEWFIDIDKVEDVDLVDHIYTKFTEWEESFRKPNEPTVTSDSGATNGEEAVDA